MTLEELGLSIRQARKSLKLTQAQLASELGMSRATVSALEAGTIGDLGIRKVMSIALRLGLEISVAPRRPYPTLQELRRDPPR